MKRSMVFCQSGLAVLIMSLVWCNWETIVPLWARVLLSASILVLAFFLYKSLRKKIDKKAMVSLTLIGTVATAVAYFMIPWGGSSIIYRCNQSFGHLAHQVAPDISLQDFCQWLDEGVSIHKWSPSMNARFQDFARQRILVSLKETQERHLGNEFEVRRYDEWSKAIPDLESRLPLDKSSAKRLRIVLKESRLVQECFADIQSSLASNDTKKIIERIRGLHDQITLTGPSEHIGLVTRRIESLTEYLR